MVALEDLLAQAGGATDPRLRAHLLAQLVCLGPHTITGLLTTLGTHLKDWSADYRLYARARLDPQALFAIARRSVEQILPADQPLVVALDDSILRKCGRKIPATAWRPDPLGAPFQVNFVWAQRVLQLSAVMPLGTAGAARTVPIDFALAPTAVRPRRQAPEAEHQAYRREKQRLNINVQALERVQALCSERQQDATRRPLWLTVDGRFTNKRFLKPVPQTVPVIGRIRGDARLYAAVEPRPASAAGGRPRWYGEALPTPEQLRQDPHVPWQEVEAFAAGKRHRFQIKSLDRVRWRVTGATRTLRLLVIAPLAYRPRKGARLLYRKPAYLICTDPTLPLESVLQAYLWRWGIEVNFREEKSLLGVGQARVRNPHAAARVPASAVAAYALLLCAAAQVDPVPHLPLPAWRRHAPTPHATTAMLINQLRHELWHDTLHRGFSDFTHTHGQDQKSLKPNPQLESAVCYAAAS